jgi:hypothetical protein
MDLLCLAIEIEKRTATIKHAPDADELARTADCHEMIIII